MEKKKKNLRLGKTFSPNTGPHCIAQAGLCFASLPTSTSLMQVVQVCTTTTI